MDYLVHHMLERSALRFAGEEAFVCGERRLTFGEVQQRVAALGRGLREAGVGRGDRVGVLLEPSVELPLSILAVSKAGGVFVPVNAALTPNQVAHIAADCSMKALILGAERLRALSQVLEQTRSLEFVVAVGESAGCVDRPEYAFDELQKAGAPESWEERCIGHDLAALLYTSGSTGKPKGVMVSHDQLMAGASIVSTYLEIGERDRLLAVLPFSFDAGLNHLMTSIQQGAALVMMSFRFGREIVDVWARERITGMGGVPSLWNLIAQPSSGLHRREFPQLRYISNTGGAMPQKVLSVLRERLVGTRIYLMYGLTEAFRSTYLPPEELDRRPTSMGRAIPNTEILVLNESGERCKPGEVGELVHRGPTVSMGYWGQPELTARVLRPHPLLAPDVAAAERVCYSGDLVKMDEDGFLYFVGRRDALIKSAGYRISPTEVEEVLFESGKLRGAAVIGLPDEVLGQVIKALVVPREGVDVQGEELVDFCAGRLPRYMVPKFVEIVDDLPKTTSGKVDYPGLRKREGIGP
jgi:acyl-CoA ligase (AMP-forming) (exosortase A-associated)